MLKVENLSMKYVDAGKPLSIFSGVNLEVGSGESVAIVGHSGVGKTSLLYLLGGLEVAKEGEIILDGVSYSSLRGKSNGLSNFRGENIGFVFQFHHLLPEFSAVENVAMPLIIKGESREVARAKAIELLSSLGLQDRLEHRPSMLSGGEQQRVAILRACISRPKLILADEPTGNLDGGTALEVFTMLKNLQKEIGISLVVVTHSMELAKKLDVIYELKGTGLVRIPS
jgi:lipoprotein-releasing system ATP-binding protein